LPSFLLSRFDVLCLFFACIFPLVQTSDWSRPLSAQQQQCTSHPLSPFSPPLTQPSSSLPSFSPNALLIQSVDPLLPPSSVPSLLFYPIIRRSERRPRPRLHLSLPPHPRSRLPANHLPRLAPPARESWWKLRRPTGAGRFRRWRMGKRGWEEVGV
jgi:hypothetical protein